MESKREKEKIWDKWERQQWKRKKSGEEETEFILDTTRDPALQENFLPFEDKCYRYTENKNEDEASIGDEYRFLE